MVRTMMSEVFPNLFVGDFEDAKTVPSEFVHINVAFEHEKTLPTAFYMPFHTPVLTVIPGSTQAFAALINKPLLDATSEIIDFNLKNGKKVFVNCNMGQERAPLTAVWYLIKKQDMSLEDAYKTVKEKRPQTLDRREWIQGFLEVSKEQ